MTIYDINGSLPDIDKLVNIFSNDCQIYNNLLDKVDQKVLRWFGHVERIYEYRMARRVLIAEVQ